MFDGLSKIIILLVFIVGGWFAFPSYEDSSTELFKGMAGKVGDLNEKLNGAD